MDANQFLRRLRQRKLVQWTLAYLAAAFALIQVVDVVAQRFDWPVTGERAFILALLAGFFVALALAWYHGERGRQQFGGAEILIIALLLAICGLLVARFGPVADKPDALAIDVQAHSPDIPKKNPETAGKDTATRAAPSVLRGAPAALTVTPIPAKSIAVLPFENLSHDKDNEYFVAGMQDLILTKLAGIGELKVIARSSTVQYKVRPDDLRAVGRQLGVATVLEGSVQKAGNEILINVQLIDAASNAHLWAESYRRTLANVFGVEGEVADKIATALKAELSSTEAAHLATSLSPDDTANDLFLRAEFKTGKGDTNFDTRSWKAAIPLYRQAIEQDPAFAMAYARLSYTEGILANFGGGGMDVQQLIRQARAHAARALKLAPDLAASQLAIGLSDLWDGSDYGGARKAFDAALALRPNDADALLAQSVLQRRQGHFDAAIDSLTRALTLDPRNPALAFDLGSIHMAINDYPDAARWYRRALALDPDNTLATSCLAYTVMAATGDLPRALELARGHAPILRLRRVDLLTLQRNYRDALALLDHVPDTPDNFVANGVHTNGGPKVLMQAELYRRMGNTERARSLYRQALPLVRAQRTMWHGINAALVWQNMAKIELGLDRTPQAMQAIARSRAIIEQRDNQFFGPGLTAINASIYARAGRADLAIPLLSKALATPGAGLFYPPAMLWLDPDWDPLRKNPRFRALLQRYADYRPATPPPQATRRSD